MAITGCRIMPITRELQTLVSTQPTNSTTTVNTAGDMFRKTGDRTVFKNAITPVLSLVSTLPIRMADTTRKYVPQAKLLIFSPMEIRGFPSALSTHSTTIKNMAIPVELALSQDIPGRKGNRLGSSMDIKRATITTATIFCRRFNGGRGFLFSCSSVRFFNLLTSGRSTYLVNRITAAVQNAP